MNIITTELHLLIKRAYLEFQNDVIYFFTAFDQVCCVAVFKHTVCYFCHQRSLKQNKTKDRSIVGSWVLLSLLFHSHNRWWKAVFYSRTRLCIKVLFMLCVVMFADLLSLSDSIPEVVLAFHLSKRLRWIEYCISWGLNIVGKCCDDITTQLNKMYYKGFVILWFFNVEMLHTESLSLLFVSPYFCLPISFHLTVNLFSTFCHGTVLILWHCNWTMALKVCHLNVECN